MNILWFVDKQFDIAPDTATWIEAAKHLQVGNDVHLVTGYKEVKVQCEGLKNEVIYNESPDIPFLNRGVGYYHQIREFETLIKRHKPDIILFNSNNCLLLRKANSLRHAYGYRAFLDVRTLPVSSGRLRNRVDSYLLGRSLSIACESFSGVTYITENMRQYCQETFNLKAHSSAVWTSGADIELFRPAGQKARNGTFRLIYHGVIAYNRGLDNVIRALGLLGAYDISFVLLGAGDAVRELKELVAVLKLDKKVVFRRAVPFKEVPHYINRADAGILPFPDSPVWNTSSPIKLFEYLACGTPVIVTKIPAHTDVLKGREFAFWAEESTPEEISQAIKSAYAARRQFGERGKQARDFVTENYTWQRQAGKLKRFIAGPGV